MKIQLLNKIAKIGLDELDSSYTVGEDIADADGIMVRSAVMHEMEFSPNLKAVARAGAGVNNIPLDRCSEAGIVVFNTPGANANGVKELAICALLLASRDVIGGVEWAKTLAGQEDAAKLVEKGKSKFAGTEIAGKTLGVIGLGAIGGLIANAGIALGMKVIGCDPFLSVDAAFNLDSRITRVASFEEIYKQADYITLHVPATKDTKNMINAASIALMKDGAKLINLARADLVNAADLKVALEAGKVSAYVTDFPTAEVLELPKTVAIPHLGASTEESENNCAVMAARELDDYLKNGNIRNSVNFPALTLPRTGAARIAVLHANSADLLPAITAAVANAGLTVANMASAAKGNTAYTVLDVTTAADAAVDAIAKINGVYKVRAI